MNLMRIGNRFFNMAGLIEAEVLEVEGGKEVEGGNNVVVLKFVAPSPASVGASDWLTGPYEVKLKGDAAKAAAKWLFSEWREWARPSIMDLNPARESEGDVSS